MPGGRAGPGCGHFGNPEGDRWDEELAERYSNLHPWAKREHVQFLSQLGGGIDPRDHPCLLADGDPVSVLAGSFHHHRGGAWWAHRDLLGAGRDWYPPAFLILHWVGPRGGGARFPPQPCW